MTGTGITQIFSFGDPRLGSRAFGFPPVLRLPPASPGE